jgi:predicted membrane protein
MKSLMVIYKMMLGMMVGIEVAAGAFVAPVLFFPQTLLGEGVLSHFQSGILMTEIFLRMNLLLLIVCVGSFIVEVFLWLSTAKYADRWATLFSLMALVLAGLFIYYYTPFIVDAQSHGEAATSQEAFRAMHKQSEWVMKVLMMTQVGLFIRRGWKCGE